MQNNHTWGDQWNGEDLSIYSEDDRPLPTETRSINQSTTSLNPDSPSFSRSEASSVTPSTLKQTLTTEGMNSSRAPTPNKGDDKAGYRAAEAFVRPHPIAVHGDVTSYGFMLSTCTFTLTLSSTSPTEQDAPTEVFLPEWHYPSGSTSVEVSGGKWSISQENELQILRWWHMEGDQTLTVKGVVRKSGQPVGATDEEEGYLEQCQKTTCEVM
jgi:hypothetical protein